MGQIPEVDAEGSREGSVNKRQKKKLFNKKSGFRLVKLPPNYQTWIFQYYTGASSVTGESWPASGKVQAEQYGQRLNYIRNIRIQGSYKIQTDEKGRLQYILEDGTDIEERDGICLYVAADQLPDYRIISIKPYRFLTMEVEKI